MPVEGLPAEKKQCDNLLEPMQNKNTRLNILSWLPCWDFSIHVTIVDTHDLLELHNNKMIIAKSNMSEMTARLSYLTCFLEGFDIFCCKLLNKLVGQLPPLRLGADVNTNWPRAHLKHNIGKPWLWQICLVVHPTSQQGVTTEVVNLLSNCFSIPGKLQ